MLTAHYWIIDALDECSRYQEFFTLLRGERPGFPLRILFTSRKMADTQRLSRLLEPTAAATVLDIPEEDIADDIERYITSRVGNLPVDSPTDKEGLAATILQKSNFSFLWVRMVMDEVENVYSTESITHVLRHIPIGMVSYYERIAKAMGENNLEKHITKAVLTWLLYDPPRGSRTTHLCTHPMLPLVFAGKYNGQVIAVDPKTEKHETLYTYTSGQFITAIATSESILASCDVNGAVEVWKLKPCAPVLLVSDALVFKFYFSAPIKQICFDPTGQYLLVSSAESHLSSAYLDAVYSINDGTRVGFLRFSAVERKAWRWLDMSQGSHASAEFALLTCNNDVLVRYNAKSFPEPLREKPARLQYGLMDQGIGLGAGATIQWALHPTPELLVVEVSFDHSYTLLTTTFVFDLGDGTLDRTFVPVSEAFSQQFRRLIGCTQGSSTIVFLHLSGWISSFDAQTSSANQYSKALLYWRRVYQGGSRGSSNQDCG